VAKVILEAIGRPREQFLTEETWARQLGNMQRLNAGLQLKRDEVRDGWGEKYRDRLDKKGKLNSWERIERLKDEDSPILPIGTLINYGRDFAGRTSPGAGVITAFVRVHGR
jgi:acetyl-CoA carboxylase carboxyltransferase component